MRMGIFGAGQRTGFANELVPPGGKGPIAIAPLWEFGSRESEVDEPAPPGGENGNPFHLRKTLVFFSFALSRLRYAVNEKRKAGGLFPRGPPPSSAGSNDFGRDAVMGPRGSPRSRTEGRVARVARDAQPEVFECRSKCKPLVTTP